MKNLSQDMRCPAGDLEHTLHEALPLKLAWYTKQKMQQNADKNALSKQKVKFNNSLGMFQIALE
jgi:hypothetical protein